MTVHQAARATLRSTAPYWSASSCRGCHKSLAPPKAHPQQSRSGQSST